VCGNCGGTNELHVHHIVPLGKGGTNKQDNLKTLCRDCHHSIHHKEKLAPTHASARKTERRSGPPSFYAERKSKSENNTTEEPKPSDAPPEFFAAVSVITMSVFGYMIAGLAGAVIATAIVATLLVIAYEYDQAT
jgi:hypothetical protein